MIYETRFQMIPKLLANDEKNNRLARVLWKLRNLPSWSEKQMTGSRLPPLSLRIASDLTRDGYAFSSVEEAGLQAEFEEACKNRVFARGSRRGSRLPFDTSWLAKNTFIKQALDEYCGLRLKPWQGGRIVHTANPGVRQGNGNWHVDVEDYHVLKVFLFLEDVGTENGPTEYIPGTHPLGSMAATVAKMARTGFIAEYGDKKADRLVRCTGPAGSILFFDSRGIHRGGHVLSGGRDVLFQAFMAPLWIHRRDQFVGELAKNYARPELLAQSRGTWKRATDWITW